MKRRLLVSVIYIVMVCTSYGCSRESGEATKSASKAMSPHSVNSDTQKPASDVKTFVSIVSKQKLPGLDSKTIGAAFEEYRYFSSREWNETRNASGKVYVDFKGLLAGNSLALNSLKAGIARHGVEVKFVVDSSGQMFVGMVSKIEVMTDGSMKLIPVEGAKKIMEQIYDNKEIIF